MTGSNTFISNLSQAARDNPLAAALIGGGALWLLLGNRAVGNAFAGVTSIAEPVAEGGMRAASSAADAVSSTAGAVANASGRAVDAATGAARSMMRTTSDATMEGAAAARDRMAGGVERATETLNHGTETLRSANPLPQLQRSYTGAQSALTDLLDRQPLIIGAIGLAIGAGVANAIASTAFENEWAGPISDEVKEAVKGRAEHVAETAQRAAGEAGREFRAAASETADTLRKAGQDAVQSVRETADTGQP
jgi:hypothetical protein